MRSSKLALVLLVGGMAQPACAQVPLSGDFSAVQNCPAVQSIRKGTNPGNVSVVVGQSYVLRGKNREDASHVLVEVPGATPLQRWVSVACGKVVGAAAPEKPVTNNNPPSTDQSFFILAVSWQAAFCEAHPGKPECVNQTEQRHDATHFTLHGLWPQPRSKVFCGATQSQQDASDKGRWSELAEVILSPATRAELDRVMPGTQSKLDRHEWIKHGTCYGDADMETYYGDSVRLMEELNRSAGAAFMAANIGKPVKASDLRAKFDETLGAGAGDRMRFACKNDDNRTLLTEITIGLKGNPASGASLTTLIMASSPTDPGCPEFVVDPISLQ
jgi:ribonuclease T2